MKKINTIGPIVCLILNIILVVGISLLGLPYKIIAIIMFVAAIGIATAFVESEGLRAHSLKGRLIILLHFITILYIGIQGFLSNISSG